MPGELLVQPEVVLQGDRGEGLVLLADLHTLLGLDRLVQALVVAAAREHAAGVLVDDEHLAVEDDVVLVVAEQLLGLDRVVQEGDQRGVRRLVEVLDAEVVLDLGDAGLEDGDGALLLVDLVVGRPCASRRAILANSAYHLTSSWVGPEMISGVRASSIRIESTSSTIAKWWPRCTQSSSGVGHVVAQVVEAELVVGAVGDVAGVGLAALVGRISGRITPTVRPRKWCTRPIHSAWYLAR